MQIRRLVKSGEASHTISLPKNWLDKNKLGKGSLIYIDERSDKELVITSQPKQIVRENKEISILVDKKDLDTIRRELTAAYINNYNTITLHGDEFDGKAKDVREMINNFVALEVSELTGSKLVAKDLLNLQEVYVDKTIRRVDNIVRSILQDATKGGNHESIKQRDFEVNKLYFLMCRILKSSLNDSRVAESFGITQAQAMSSWHLSMTLENIADISKNISLYLEEAKNVKKELAEIYADIEKSYLDAMKAHYNRDKKLADEVSLKRMELISRCEDFLGKNKNLETYKVINSFNEMINLVNNVARIVIDEE